MSGHRDIEESGNTTKAADNSALFNSIDSARNSMSPKDYSNIFQSPGKDNLASLPSLELMDAKSDVPPPPTISYQGTSDKDLAQDGVKRAHGVGADGKSTSSTEFPNGVKISTGGGGEETMPDGTKITLSPSQIVETPANLHLHEHPKGSGVFVDSHNKTVLTDNADGSKSIYTDKGVYTAREDGSVTKESAIKDRHGNWTVIDTSTPLGGMRPSDMVKQPGH